MQVTGSKTERWVIGLQQMLINYYVQSRKKGLCGTQTCGTDKTFIVQLQ